MDTAAVVYKFHARIVSGCGLDIKVDPRPGLATLVKADQGLHMYWGPLNSLNPEEMMLLQPGEVRVDIRLGPNKDHLIRLLFIKSKLERHFAVEENQCEIIRRNIMRLLDNSLGCPDKDGESTALAPNDGESTAHPRNDGPSAAIPDKDRQDSTAENVPGLNTNTQKRSSRNDSKKDKKILAYFRPPSTSIPPAYRCLDQDEEFNDILTEVETQAFPDISLKDEIKKPSGIDQRLDKLSDSQLLNAAGKIMAHRNADKRSRISAATQNKPEVQFENAESDVESDLPEAESALLIPILSYAAVQDVVWPFVEVGENGLPETEQELKMSVQSSIFKEIVSHFVTALKSRILGTAFDEIPVSQALQQAAKSGDVRHFLDVLKAEKENEGNFTFAGETQL